MPRPARTRGLRDELSKGGRSPSTPCRTSDSLLAALQILNGGSCPVPPPRAKLGEGLPRRVKLWECVGRTAHPTLAQTPGPRGHVLQLSPGVPLLKPHFPGSGWLWKNSSCTGACGGAARREPDGPASPVFPPFSFLKYLISHFLLLFYFLFHLQFSLVTCQDSQFLFSAEHDPTFTGFGSLFFFLSFVHGVFATEKWGVPFWPTPLRSQISAGWWVGLENTHYRLFGLIICVSLRLAWFQTDD